MSADARALWCAGRDRLVAAGIEDAAWEADCLWRHACGADFRLLGRQAPPPEGAKRFAALVARRAAHEPLQYLLGRWAFLDFEVEVAPGVLIPRQDTECVAACALEAGRALLAGTPQAAESLLWVDLCAGSGVLALALARGLRVPTLAVELSPAALPLLRRNAAAALAAGAPPPQVVQGDLFTYQAELPAAGVALLVCNPPYLTTQELAAAQEELHFEPPCALDGGPDGLRFYRHLAGAYRDRLAPCGRLVLEIGAAQGPAVCGLLRAAGWRDIRLLPDAEGRPRCVCAAP